ncbi:MAG: hypothetical protein AABX53_01440 [Nanoarchaeota archaeon]
MVFQEEFGKVVTYVDERSVYAYRTLLESSRVGNILGLDLGMTDRGIPQGLKRQQLAGDLTRTDLIYPQYGALIEFRPSGLTPEQEELYVHIKMNLLGLRLFGAYHDALVRKGPFLDEVVAAIKCFDCPRVNRAVDDYRLISNVLCMAGKTKSRDESGEIKPELRSTDYYFGDVLKRMNLSVAKIERFCARNSE